MTLLITDIGSSGIVFAADSAITLPDHKQLSQPKIVKLERLNAAIGYYGVAAVNGGPMYDWLESLSRHTSAGDLEAVAHELVDKLKPWPSLDSTGCGTGFHLAGYIEVEERMLPTFWHIWNHGGVDVGYRTTGLGFRATEDFLSRVPSEYIPNDLDAFFAQTGNRVYRNGTLKPYVSLANCLYPFFKELWQTPGFPAPRSLPDWAWHYRFQVDEIKRVYQILRKKRESPIGHETKVVMIYPDGRIEDLPSHRPKD